MVTGQMLYPAYLLIHSRSEDFDYTGLPGSGEDITSFLDGQEFDEDPPHPGFIAGKVIETLTTNPDHPDQDGLLHWIRIEVVFSNQQDLDNFLNIPWSTLLEDYKKDC